ncbi:MAG: fluoride efflux transporter FluC [Actinomycetes bacterium]
MTDHNSSEITFARTIHPASNTASRIFSRHALVAGTGFLGAFTTYSALALDVTALLGSGWFEAAGVYVGLSLAGGLTAAWAGIHVAVLWRESPSGNAAEHESGAE